MTARPRSLAYVTDFTLSRFDGDVVDRGAYWVVRTPSNPTFNWGNCLVFREPPTVDDAQVDGWERLFERELGATPGEGHRLLAWDRPDGAIGELGPFLARGYAIDEHVVLTGDRVVSPPHPNCDLAIGTVDSDDAWAAAERLLSAAFDGDGMRVFLGRQIARYRAMVRAGMGAWFGAWLGDELAGTLGIFREGELGRFQLVATHPRFRRRGVCGSLVHAAAEHALGRMGARKLVICAEAKYHAARIYESVGLCPTERLFAVIRRQPPRG